MAKATSTTKIILPKEFLDAMKQSLLDEKETLAKELTGLKRNPHDGSGESAFPNYGDSEDENAAEVADYIVNLSLGENLERSLRDVIQALERLERGTYGICKYCNKPIEKKRLQARPTSSSCMGCKKAITQEI